MTGKNKSNLQEETKEQCFRRIRKYKDGLYYHSSQTVHDVNFLLCEVDSLRTLLAEKEKELAELREAAKRVWNERPFGIEDSHEITSRGKNGGSGTAGPNMTATWCAALKELSRLLESPAAPEQKESK